MHDEISNQVELSSDIEWLLLSERTRADDLVVQLVGDFGAELSLLMNCMFDDTEIAENALVDTLAQLVWSRNRFQAGQPVKTWLYSLALETVWQLRRRWKLSLTPSKSEPNGSGPSFKRTDGIPEWMEYLPEQPKLVTLLQRYMGLEPAEISQVLRIPDLIVTETLATLDRVFPPESSVQKRVLADSSQQRLMEETVRKLTVKQPRGKLRRNLLEISWVMGALLIIALLTRIYDLVNPDLVRQAFELSFLTPMPTSTREPVPTATPLPWLDMSDSSEEIALRYWQRWQNVETIWIDYLIMLGGAQGGLTGYSPERVELAWDVRTGNRMILVGHQEGPPEYGFYSVNNDTYEFAVRYGRMAETTIDNPRLSYAFYLADLALNLQINNFDGNWTFKPVGDETVLGRDALVVEAINMEGLLDNRTYLDSITGIPLIQQRFRAKGEKDQLVLYIVVNNIAVDEPIPVEHFSTEPSRRFQFRKANDWSGNPLIEENLSRWKRLFIEQAVNNNRINPDPPVNYQVFAMANQQGIKYSTGVIADNVLVGEYPMGNPWSVLCERSPDGSRVAFIEDRRFEFGSTMPSHVLHWFSIDNPGVLNTPLPYINATRFTFSPDSRYLAVHASNEVMIIDLVNGMIDPLLVTPSVDRLVFSSGGRYLGVLRSSVQTAGATSIWIIDLITKEIVETLHLEPEQDWESQRADNFATRYVDFSKPVYFGLENCR